MENIHAERAVDYYGRNFNCTQGVFTTYAIEHGIDEKLALKLATNFGGGARKGELLGYDLSKPEEKAVILEKNLFRRVCPDLIRSAVEILDEFLEEQKQ